MKLTLWPTNQQSIYTPTVDLVFADNFFWQVDCFSTTSAIFLALLLLDTPWISFISHRRPLYSSRQTSTTIDDDHTTIVQPLQCSKLTGTLGSCSKSPGYSQFVFKSTGWISFGTVWYCVRLFEYCWALFGSVSQCLGTDLWSWDTVLAFWDCYIVVGFLIEVL